MTPIRVSAHSFRAESDAHIVQRIRDLRQDAGDKISEAADLEELLPDQHEHIPCPVCESCRLAIVAEAERLSQTDSRASYQRSRS